MQIFVEGRGAVSVPEGTSGRRLLEEVIGAGGYFALSINGEVVDCDAPVPEAGRVVPLGFDSEDGRQVYWHSSSHLLAAAVKELYPDARLAIGPAISEGFYYDFDRAIPFSEEDLRRIEETMGRMVDADIPFRQELVRRDEALALFESAGERYKVEILSEVKSETVALYRTGDFVDLCRGPHLPSVGWVKAWKLLSVAGAYWRGLECNPMLQRIYGVSFPSAGDLDEHLARLKEAEKRDHRKLGVALDLFSIEEAAGSGLVFWHPKGATLRNTIEDFWRGEHRKRGYQLVYTPHIARAGLWDRSGHTSYYKDNMYVLDVEDQPYVLKPMSCPGHILIFQSKRRSYRELPIRYAELGTVYRRERSGVLHGMFRVRGFTQDDGHIFCSKEQMPREIDGVLDLTMFMLDSFGFKDFDVRLSVRDPARKEQFAGDDESWDAAEDALKCALERHNLPFKRAEGEAVFYGPKIDVNLLDAIGRGWQGATIQFDFNLPQRFCVTYVGSDGKPHPVYMIHRVVLGAMERFVATLIEHHAGEFPVWLAPVQVQIVSMGEANEAWANEVLSSLSGDGIRAEGDFRDETLGSRIRDAELQKIPYVLVIGKRETAERVVSVRSKKKGQMGVLALDEFKKNLLAEIAQRM
ncbi:MAG: threonine--tRNA ligase [Candidatus Eisenbacteria bacterium]